MTELEQFIIKTHTIDGDIHIDDSEEMLRETSSLMIHDTASEPTELIDQLIKSSTLRELASSITFNFSDQLQLLCEVQLLAKKNLIAEIERKIKCIDLTENEENEENEELEIFNRTEAVGINTEFQ